jgi:hypothetical protein
MTASIQGARIPTGSAAVERSVTSGRIAFAGSAQLPYENSVGEFGRPSS